MEIPNHVLILKWAPALQLVSIHFLATVNQMISFPNVFSFHP